MIIARTPEDEFHRKFHAGRIECRGVMIEVAKRNDGERGTPIHG